MSDTMAPCPFCGATDIKPTNNPYEDGRPCWYVGHLCDGPLCVNVDTRVHSQTAAEAIAAWNRRAMGWRPIGEAPKDRFILLWCPEDKSRWLAKWQGDVWYGVDDCGLTRTDGYHAGSGRVTGWEITAWQPLPAAPEAKP